MAPSLMDLVFLSILQNIFVHTAGAVTCFGVNGLGYPDNVICPGSNACCGSTATCLPNRLCHNEGQNNETFVRGPCALNPYNVDSCAEICIYNETAVDQGFLPRVTVCADGSYCCDNDPNCCEAGQGVFLDSTGDIVSSLPGSSSSSSRSSSTPASSSSSSLSSSPPSSFSGSASATTTSASQIPSQTASNTQVGTSSSSSSSSAGLSIGAKIGLGIGIPLGIIVLGVLIGIIWLQQRRVERVEKQLATSPEGAAQNQLAYAQQQWEPPKEMDSYQTPVAVELPAGDRGQYK